MDDGMVLLPNDRYPLDREVFRLYYTSECEDQQSIDIYFEDNSEPAQLCLLTFDFNNENADGEDEGDADSDADDGSSVTALPADTAVALHTAVSMAIKPLLP